jgi:hypothetical protein
VGDQQGRVEPAGHRAEAEADLSRVERHRFAGRCRAAGGPRGRARGRAPCFGLPSTSAQNEESGGQHRAARDARHSLGRLK